MKNQTLPYLVSETAQRDGDRIFGIDVGGSSVTFAELDENASRRAGAFAALGIGRGDVVATMLETSVDALTTWIALAKLGAIDCPFSLVNSPENLAFLVGDAGAGVAIVSPSAMPLLAGAAGAHLRTVMPNELERLAGEADPVPDHPRNHDVACLIYTSGTTSRPKGVVVSWGQLRAAAGAWEPLFDRDTVFYAPYLFTSIGGRQPAVTMALVGGKVVYRNGFDVSTLWDDLRRYGCTSFNMPAPLLDAVCRQPPRLDDADNPLSVVTMGPLPSYANKTPSSFAKDFCSRFGVELYRIYNMTETSVPLAPQGSSAFESCGRAREGYEARLVDENDEEVPHGEVGELILRTSQPWQMMTEYFRLPEQTVKVWRNGWFHTEDLLTRDVEGNFYFVDRKVDALRVSGRLRSSSELEWALLLHDHVADCAAVGVHEEGSESVDAEIKVIVVPTTDAGLDAPTLFEYLRATVEPALLPRYIEIVDSLPITENTRKVRKAALRQLWRTSSTWDASRGAFLEVDPDASARTVPLLPNAI